MKSRAILAAALLSGCATNESNMQSYIGQTESELLSEWGAPTHSMDTRDGNRVLTWESPYGKNGQRLCRQSFTVDSNGIIRSYSLQNCPP